MPKIDHEFWESARFNNQTFMYYYVRLVELSISMFEWKGLPDTVDPRFMELALFSDGFAVYFEDDVVKEQYCLRSMIGGRWSIYNIPTLRTAYASNGYHVNLDEKNSVLIYNNMTHTNSLNQIEMFARRLWDLDRTIDVNAKAQKTPILLQCPENMKLTLLNLYQKYDGNQPFIFGNKDLDPNAIKSITTGAPYVAGNIYELKTNIWNEALTYLGISSVNNAKRERLITDEVRKDNADVIASRYSRLEARRQACEQINRMFGTNITVDYRADFENQYDNWDSVRTNVTEEVEVNG